MQAALEADPDTKGRCDVEIRINDVANMKGKGQVIPAIASAAPCDVALTLAAPHAA